MFVFHVSITVYGASMGLTVMNVKVVMNLMGMGYVKKKVYAHQGPIL